MNRLLIGTILLSLVAFVVPASLVVADDEPLDTSTAGCCPW